MYSSIFPGNSDIFLVYFIIKNWYRTQLSVYFASFFKLIQTIMLYTILTVIIAIICALLIVVVLLQNGSGQGLSGIGATSMGGSAGLGARRTADLLSKATSYLGGIFLLLCVLANFVIEKPKSQNSILQSGAPLMQDNSMPPMPTFDNSSTDGISQPDEE